MPLYRVNGGEWKVCRESRGAEGLVIIWQQTAQAAQQYARKWVAKNQKRHTATTA